MKLTLFLCLVVINCCIGFRMPMKKCKTVTKMLHDHHFYMDAYNDIKNSLLPHDIYTTIASESANMFVRNIMKKTEQNSTTTVNNTVDSVLFFGCCFMGIPQTFNPFIISAWCKNDNKKQTICTFVDISKWLIYSKLVQMFGRDEATFLCSSFIATSFSSAVKYLLLQNYRVDVFFKKEIIQILFFEHTKDILEYLYPLDIEMPFATLVDQLELELNELMKTEN